jgi:signal transduction histidine kinase
MDVKDLVNSWKAILSFGSAIVVATVAVLVYASEASKEEIILMKAQSALIHNDYYQQNRIQRKEIEIRENQRELKSLLNYIGDDEPTPREERDIEYLDSEIARLRSEIEEIRVQINTSNE